MKFVIGEWRFLQEEVVVAGPEAKGLDKRATVLKVTSNLPATNIFCEYQNKYDNCQL